MSDLEQAARCEYAELRNEMRLYHQQNFQTESFGIAGLIGFYGWLSTKAGQIPEPTYFLPIGFSFLICLRLIAYRKRMARLALYLAITETRLGLEPGWEGFLRTSRGLDPVQLENIDSLAEAEKIRKTEQALWSTWRTRYFTWAVITVLSVVMSFFLALHPTAVSPN